MPFKAWQSNKKEEYKLLEIENYWLISPPVIHSILNIVNTQ